MSSFFRRHVRGLLRTTFSAPQSTETISSIANNVNDDFDEHNESEEERLLLALDHHFGPAGTSSESQSLYKNGKKRVKSAPEVYSGKTGLDLPNIHVGPLALSVKACHTGPDGGLTCVQPMRQRTIAKMAKLDDEEFSLSSMDEEKDEEDEAKEEEINGNDFEDKEVKEENKKDDHQMNEVMEEMNGFRPVDEDSEDLEHKINNSQLNKINGKSKLLNVPLKETNNKKTKKKMKRLTGGSNKALIQSADSIEALGLVGTDDFSPYRNGSVLEHFDWSSWDECRALGISTSLYERHPVSGLPAGHPIADVFGIIARENNAILALADGVNWGDGARLAARCAIRGAIDHLNAAIERQQLHCTNDIFHSMLGAFHAAHALILQEGGALTTLCLALVVPVKSSDSSVLCVCNVGDSLCFVYNQTHGVNEITLGSHNISTNRDMRDAGGALGPVDGRNPQLHNLTCSMTFVEKGDLVFITSDGVSDNFDPVVGKFCSIRRPREEEEEIEITEAIEKENNLISNNQQQKNITTTIPLPPPFHKTKSAPATNNENIRKPINGTHISSQNKSPLQNTNNNNFVPSSLCEMKRRPPVATLPVVDAPQRHELMLLRMNDIITNGLSQPTFDNSLKNSPNQTVQQYKQISAVELCNNLVQFAYKLSSAKRHTLEDPELYRTRTHSRTEERLRRKMIRNMIMEMPGKLDHASVVAYQVGSEWPPSTNNNIESENNEITIFEDFTLNNSKIQVEIKEEREEENAEKNYNKFNNPNKQSVAVQCSWRPPATSFNRSQQLLQQQNKTLIKEINNSETINTSKNNNNEQKHPIIYKNRTNNHQIRKTDLSPSKIVSTKNCEENNLLKTKEKIPVNKETNKSPYEELPSFGDVAEEENSKSENYENKQYNGNTERKSKRHHGRGSLARHTLGVDVSWLKRLVANKHGINEEENNNNNNINNKHLNNKTQKQQQKQHSPTLLNGKKQETRFSSTSSSSSSTNSQKQHNPRLDSFDLLNKNLKKGSSSTINSLRKIKAAFASSSRQSSERRQIINKNNEINTPINTTNSLIVSIDLNGNNIQKSPPHQRSLSQCYCRPIPPPLSANDLAKLNENSVSNSPPSSAPPIITNKNHRFIQNGNLKNNNKNINVPRMGIGAGAAVAN